jgi:hypothetical protein
LVSIDSADDKQIKKLKVSANTTARLITSRCEAITGAARIMEITKTEINSEIAAKKIADEAAVGNQKPEAKPEVISIQPQQLPKVKIAEFNATLAMFYPPEIDRILNPIHSGVTLLESVTPAFNMELLKNEKGE